MAILHLIYCTRHGIRKMTSTPKQKKTKKNIVQVPEAVVIYSELAHVQKDLNAALAQVKTLTDSTEAQSSKWEKEKSQLQVSNKKTTDTYPCHAWDSCASVDCVMDRRWTSVTPYVTPTHSISPGSTISHARSFILAFGSCKILLFIFTFPLLAWFKIANKPFLEFNIVPPRSSMRRGMGGREGATFSATWTARAGAEGCARTARRATAPPRAR